MPKPLAENIVRCPYIPEHAMAIQSLLTHLTRCKATNKHLFTACLYNCLHVVPKQHYQAHIKTCPDRMASHQAYPVCQEDDEEESWVEPKPKRKFDPNYVRDDWNDSSYSSSRHSSNGEEWLSHNQSQNDSGYGFYDYNQQQDNFKEDKLQGYSPPDYSQYRILPEESEERSQKYLNYKDYQKPGRHSGSYNTLRKPEPNFYRKEPTQSQHYPRQYPRQYPNYNEEYKKRFILAESDKDTYQESKKSRDRQPGRAQYSSEDNELIEFIEEIDHNMKKFTLNDSHNDSFGDVLAEQASVLRGRRQQHNTSYNAGQHWDNSRRGHNNSRW